MDARELAGTLHAYGSCGHGGANDTVEREADTFGQPLSNVYEHST